MIKRQLQYHTNRMSSFFNRFLELYEQIWHLVAVNITHIFVMQSKEWLLSNNFKQVID